VSENDVKALEEKTGLHRDVFSNQKGEAVDEYFLGFQKNGSCFFLNENNGGYSCGVYEARPKVCRNYPSNPRQEEFCGRMSRPLNKESGGKQGDPK